MSNWQPYQDMTTLAKVAGGPEKFIRGKQTRALVMVGPFILLGGAIAGWLANRLTQSTEAEAKDLPGWTVVDAEGRVVKPYFTGTYHECVAWLGEYEDQAKVLNGGFNIDAPPWVGQ